MMTNIEWGFSFASRIPIPKLKPLPPAGRYGTLSNNHEQNAQLDQDVVFPDWKLDFF